MSADSPPRGLDLALDDRVVVVTGGGRGIGGAVAGELARQRAQVVVLDPGRTVRGETGGGEEPAEHVAEIVAAGGRAELARVSVTDREAVKALFADVVDRHGRLDAVVHAAGTLRLPRLVDSDEDDWTSVMDVHFHGYLNVLSAALPIMARAGYGRIVGFTSGVGLTRTIIDGPSYGCAKRAIAALTWRIGQRLPSGVAINALSPIAATKMVREMLAAGGRNTEGLDLSGMTQPDEVAPTVAYLVSERAGWCSGQVIFSVGSELSLNRPAALVEAVRAGDVADLPAALDALLPVVFEPAESGQATTGGYHPRVQRLFEAAPSDAPPPSITTECVVVDAGLGEVNGLVDDVEGALAARGVKTARLGPNGPASFADAERALAAARDFGAVVVASTYSDEADDSNPASVIDSHASVTDHLIRHIAWLRAGARSAAATGRPLRIVHVIVAPTAAGRTAAEVVTQAARCVNDTPGDTRVEVFSISVENSPVPARAIAGGLASFLVGSPGAERLAGAELVVDDGWIGLRRHPGPASTLSCGSDGLPVWFEEWLKQAVTGVRATPLPMHSLQE